MTVKLNRLFSEAIDKKCPAVFIDGRTFLSIESFFPATEFYIISGRNFYVKEFIFLEKPDCTIWIL